jgi:ABC-2 type transport system permease protein
MPSATERLGRIFALTRKDLVIWSRNRASVFFTLAWPLVIALFFGMVFGGGGGRSATLRLGLVLEDAHPSARAFAERLAAHEGLLVEPVSRAQAEERIRRGSMSFALVVPEGFGGSILRFFNGEVPALRLLFDPARRSERGLIEGLLFHAAFATAFAEVERALFAAPSPQTALREVSAGMPAPVAAAFERFLEALAAFRAEVARSDAALRMEASFVPTLPFTAEAIAATGMRPPDGFAVSFIQAMFWALLGAMMSMLSELVRERMTGTFERLRASPASPGEILLGSALSAWLLMLLALGLLALLAFLIGIRPSDPLKLLAAAAAASFAFTGLTLLFASAGDSMQAVHGTTWAVMLPLAMVGGAMVPLFLLPSWLATLSHLSPVKWTVLALEGAYWRQMGWAELAPALATLLGIGLLAALLGIRRILARA